uniref:Uncharacterized protein n=1 Tax=Vitis vinifera TaxID=29760 RepID=A5B9M1_VITVI|nr:hypothetical protein VITISV_003020 [Vitis vinifera]
MSVAHIEKLQENTATLCKMDVKLSGSKVELAETEENLHHAWVVQILKVLCKCCVSFAQAEGVVRVSRCCANFVQAWSSCLPKAISSSFQLQIVHGLKRWIIDFLSFEMSNSIQIPQEDTRRAPLFGLPQGEAHDTRDHHTLDDGISYPDMLSGSLSHTPCIPDLLMEKDFKASVLHGSELSIALPWIPKNSPQSRIALVIKKLSKHQNLT